MLFLRAAIVIASDHRERGNPGGVKKQEKMTLRKR